MTLLNAIGVEIMSPPPQQAKSRKEPLDFDALNKAINTAKAAFQLFTVANPIVRGAAEIHVDVPVMYMDFAIDKIHYDPYSKGASPKGRPVKARVEVDLKEVQNRVENILKEAQIIEAAEFREPEKAWIVPVAWNKLIIMHVKVSYDGEEIVPDYGLTKEVRKHVI